MLNLFRNQFFARICPALDRGQDTRLFQHGLVWYRQRVQGVLNADLKVDVFFGVFREDDHPFVEELETVVVEEQTSE